MKTTAVAKLAGVQSISAGGAHTCAVLGAAAAARVRCWGSDTSGQQGTAAAGIAKFATLTTGTVCNGARAVAAGAAHTLVLSPASGIPVPSLAGWGLNSSGQLGDNTATSHVIPVRSGFL